MLDVERPKDHVIDGVDFVKALRGEDMDRGPMFTLVPGHGNTPQWLPPAMAVHHGDWKLIRIFHYGEDGNHDYRLYNLREDIGESNNLAAVHPEKVETLDGMIEDYIAAAKVVVPLPNPNFDPAEFDPSAIGIQVGGLKMPPSSRTSQKRTRAARAASTVDDKSLLGWTAKNTEVTVVGDSLRFTLTGQQAFLTNAKVRCQGPAELGLRVRTRSDGTARLQWRIEGQDRFPATGQSKSFAVAGGDWQELSVPLDAQGRVVHLRLFLPVGKQSVEIDWIEIRAGGGNDKDKQRWDFRDAADSMDLRPHNLPAEEKGLTAWPDHRK
jgi:hypothetical protein